MSASLDPTATRADEQVPELRIEIDLVERSDRERPRIAAGSIPRARLSMTIRLPIGFEHGDYALQVLESEFLSRATAHTPRNPGLRDEGRRTDGLELDASRLVQARQGAREAFSASVQGAVPSA